EQGTDLGLAESPVASGRPDAADAAGGRPAGNRLRVDSEESSDLSRSEKPLTVPVHAFPLLTSVWRSLSLVSRTKTRYLPGFPEIGGPPVALRCPPDARLAVSRPLGHRVGQCRRWCRS